MRLTLYTALLYTAGASLGLATPSFAHSIGSHPTDRIDTVVVIYMENHSFDNLFGLFPGATGIADAIASAPKQVTRTGEPMAVLPAPIDTGAKPAARDPRFPADLPNAPFPIDQYVGANLKTGDLIHRFYTNQEQIDGGKNDKFAALSDAAGLAMGYYHGEGTALWKWAKQYTLADHFFMGAFGGSFLNHQMLIAGAPPRFDHAPLKMVSTLDAAGHAIVDGPITPDGYAVNTVQSVYQPHDPRITDPSVLLPPQDQPTIGDRLSAKHISWAWYAGGYAQALNGHGNEETFQYHHQPFVYYRAYGDGTPAKALHLKDGSDFLSDIAKGALPHVAFYKPSGPLNQHPGYADVSEGDDHLDLVLDRLRHSPQWPHMLIIVTYDENGGFYDHVAPPKRDRWGPGSRVPTVIISPFAKRGYVDHTIYDTLSILAFIEHRWHLKPLGTRDAQDNPLLGAFDPP